VPGFFLPGRIWRAELFPTGVDLARAG